MDDPLPISNADLDLSDLPRASADQEMLDRFAQSFNGYEIWGNARVRRMANVWNEAWRGTGGLPETLTEVRGCLFFEQRRHNHMSPDYAEGQFEYEAALLERLRSLLEAGVSDDEHETTASWLARNPDPGHWDHDRLRSLLHEAVREATLGISDVIAAREGSYGLEEDLRGGVVDSLRGREELVLTEGKLAVEGWSANLGGFDFALVGDDGSLALGETKWADGKLYECLWDIFKLASATTMPRVLAGFAVYGAPVKHWEKPVACAELFASDSWLTTNVIETHPGAWKKNLGGTNARPTGLPLEFATNLIASYSTDVLGRAWEVRLLEVRGGEIGTWLEDGWPPTTPEAFQSA
jgi:hypothetical protein